MYLAGLPGSSGHLARLGAGDVEPASGERAADRGVGPPPWPKQLEPQLMPSSWRIGPLTMTMGAQECVVASVPCKLYSGSSTPRIAAVTTGKIFRLAAGHHRVAARLWSRHDLARRHGRKGAVCRRAPSRRTRHFLPRSARRAACRRSSLLGGDSLNVSTSRSRSDDFLHRPCPHVLVASDIPWCGFDAFTQLVAFRPPSDASPRSIAVRPCAPLAWPEPAGLNVSCGDHVGRDAALLEFDAVVETPR